MKNKIPIIEIMLVSISILLIVFLFNYFYIQINSDNKRKDMMDKYLSIIHKIEKSNNNDFVKLHKELQFFYVDMQDLVSVDLFIERSKDIHNLEELKKLYNDHALKVLAYSNVHRSRTSEILDVIRINIFIQLFLLVFLLIIQGIRVLLLVKKDKK